MSPPTSVFVNVQQKYSREPNTLRDIQQKQITQADNKSQPPPQNTNLLSLKMPTKTRQNLFEYVSSTIFVPTKAYKVQI